MIDASGDARITDVAAFDLEVFAGTGAMLSPTTECVVSNEWQRVNDRPQGADVEGRLAIQVPAGAVGPQNGVKYSAVYDFANNAVDGKPALGWTNVLTRHDIYIRNGQQAQIQVSGWTLWGDTCAFRFGGIALRVLGRLECGFWL